jgi:molybdenum cofactor biosynthesis enzyme MoaA
MKPRLGLYFVTLACNDSCEFCRHWRESENKPVEESQFKGDKLFRELKVRGVKTLHFTGGEPLLRPDLPERLRAAKKLGLHTELTTNGILYPERARELTGLCDRLFFSLDYPLAEEHDRSRGVECFNLVLSAIRQARQAAENAIINFTITRDSVRFLPEMIELADKLGVMVNLSPVYDFYGLQGFEPMTVDHIKYYARRSNVLANLAGLEFIKAGGNQVILPRCRAQETTITVLPDDSFTGPCFYNQGRTQGKEAVCSSCMRWPYMLPSFSVGIDKYFWLNLYSDWLNRYKLKKWYGLG